MDVDFRYLRILLKKPLYLEDLILIPEIKDKYLLDGFQAATMPLDPETYKKIVSLIQTEQNIYENIGYEQADSLDDILGLELKYQNAAPEVKEIISKRIERGRAANEFKKMRGFKCMLCESVNQNPISFYKKNGEPYIEVHHVIPVANLQTGSLCPSNLMTLCANHHRQLHYGNVELIHNTGEEIVFRIEQSIIHIKKIMD